MDVDRLVKANPPIPPEQMLVYVERRLDEWARWYSRGNLPGLGYPPCSLEYRLMKAGGVRTQAPGQRFSPVNESADAMEKLVQEMALQNALMALALRRYYFHHRSLRTQATHVGVSYGKLKALVDMAKQWIVGRLSGDRAGCLGSPAP